MQGSAKRVLRSAKRYLTSRRTVRALRPQRLDKVAIGGVAIYVRPNSPDLDVAKSCLEGEFQPALEAADPPKYNFIIDAGGYIGAAAIIFAKTFPAVTVVTIEPSIENFFVLRKNVAPFSNIVPINKALSSELGTLSLVDRWSGRLGFSTYTQAGADCPDPVLQHTTDAITIDVLLDQFGKSGIDLLKLDIEGSEREILKSSRSWIDRTSVIFAELHDRFLPGCEAAFAEATQGRTNTSGEGEKILSVVK
jgi:FkbM family methyltransferase